MDEDRGFDFEDAKGFLSDRITDIATFVQGALATKILEELSEIVPDILAAFADGKIDEQEKLQKVQERIEIKKKDS